MAYGSTCLCSNELKKLSQKTREWGEGLLDSEEIGFFRTLPKSDQFMVGGLSFHVTHCNGNYGMSFHTDPDDISMSDYDRPNSRLHHDFVITGHSHKPYIKKVGGTTYLNPGSVGQPRDFNPRASYAVIEYGEATIKRTNYDIEKTVKELQNTSLPKKSVESWYPCLLENINKDNQQIYTRHLGAASCPNFKYNFESVIV
jgi:predicted phosphodiesterase